MIKREGYRIVVPQEFQDRIATGLCPVCSLPKSDWVRSITWRCCSKKCTKEYGEKIFLGWPALRRAAIKRDGKCVKCGKVYTISKELLKSDIDYYWGKYELILEKKFLKRHEIYDDEDWDVLLIDMSKYVVDHIHPIAMGGAEWDLANLQTLCIQCNKDKTKVDAGKIAALRTKELLVNAGQAFLEDE